MPLIIGKPDVNDMEMNEAETSRASEEHQGRTMDGLWEIIAPQSVVVPIKGVPEIPAELENEPAVSYSRRLTRKEKVKPYTVDVHRQGKDS